MVSAKRGLLEHATVYDQDAFICATYRTRHHAAEQTFVNI